MKKLYKGGSTAGTAPTVVSGAGSGAGASSSPPQIDNSISFADMFKHFGMYSPVLVSFFMITSSFYNQDLKGVIFFVGAIVSVLIGFLFKKIIDLSGGEQNKKMNKVECTRMSLFGGTSVNVPSLRSVFMGYALSYIIFPMIVNNNYNYPFLSILLSITALSAFVEAGYYFCTTVSGVVLGIILGIFCGIGWYFLFKSTGNNNFLYFSDEPSNNVSCSRPNKQTFKCKVYKNGELVKTV